MTHLSEALNLIGQLLRYPEPGTIQLVERLCAELQTELADAGPSALEFLVFAQQNDCRAIEEVFTHTFDINPTCALEVGWHLFGEEYIRGLFMVRVREELRKYGLPETVELPDHIAHVLSVTAAMPSEEATRFVCACVLPAVKKMNQAMRDKETPYRHILSCLESVLTIQWGDAWAASEGAQATTASAAGSDDLLRAFPISDVADDCEACCRVSSDAVPQNLVPRETEFPDLGGHVDHPAVHASASDVADQCNSASGSIQAPDREESPTPTPARKR